MSHHLPQEAHAASFEHAAELYERGRPPYPDAALDWLLPPNAQRVVDVGAGTGKLTRQLVERGLDVTAVEPSAAMLDVLRDVVPDARPVLGSAERLDVPDGSADAALAAQSWHWVNAARAAAEAARVLRPGGRLCLLWNLRDDTEPWAVELGQIIEGSDHRDVDVPDPLGGSDAFDPVEELRVSWVHTVDRDEVLAMVASRSYVILMDDEHRTQLLDRVRRLLDTHPDTATRDRFPIPYTTLCQPAARR